MSDQPLRTVSRAAHLARAGDIITIRPGDYRETAVAFPASGTVAKPIVLQAESPGSVRIIGGPDIKAYTRDGAAVLFGSDARDPENSERWAGAQYVTVRGIHFRNAPGTAIAAGTGWRIEDCLIERPNYDGIVPRGDHITIARTVVQDAGNNGIAGGFGRDIRIEDTIIRRCNQFPYEAGDTSGATKLLHTDGLVVRNLISYDNFGSGLWLDWDNINYQVSGCTVFANHAGVAWARDGRPINQEWAAPGIWTEGNPGPGRIADNVIYSNVGAGIGVLESRDLSIENNLIVDCGFAIEFRDLQREGNELDPDRYYRVLNVRVRNNVFKSWRYDAAIFTSVGNWKRGRRPSDYDLKIDANVYDPRPGLPHFSWLGTQTRSLAASRKRLGVESAGLEQRVTFAGPLVETRSTGEAELRSGKPGRLRQVNSAAAEAMSIDASLRGRVNGEVVQIPVFGRRALPGDPPGQMIVYDLAAGRPMRVQTLDKELEDRLTRTIPPYASLQGHLVEVRLTSSDPYALEGVVIEYKGALR